MNNDDDNIEIITDIVVEVSFFRSTAEYNLCMLVLRDIDGAIVFPSFGVSRRSYSYLSLLLLRLCVCKVNNTILFANIVIQAETTITKWSRLFQRYREICPINQ